MEWEGVMNELGTVRVGDVFTYKGTGRHYQVVKLGRGGTAHMSRYCKEEYRAGGHVVHNSYPCKKLLDEDLFSRLYVEMENE